MLMRADSNFPGTFGSPIVHEAIGTNRAKLVASASPVDANQANMAWFQDSQSLVVRGIYSLTAGKLQYCFAQPGKDRPGDFKVTKGSGRTLVRLKRFSTGEGPVVKELAAAGVYAQKDEIGWVTALQFMNSKGPLQPALSKATKLKKLTGVYFEEQKLTPDDFRELSRISSLRELTIQSKQVTLSGMAAFKPSGAINSLLLRGKGVTDASLEGVTIANPGTLHLQRTSLSGPAIADFISRHAGLTRVNLDGVQVDQNVLIALGKLKNLRTLSISRGNFGDEHASHVARIKSLDGLLIQDTDITDAGLRKLTALKNLTFLRAGETKITDDGLRMVADSFPKLRTLYLWGKGNRVTNDGIRALRNHPSLNRIHASKPIDDAIVRDVVEELRRRHREQPKAAEEE